MTRTRGVRMAAADALIEHGDRLDIRRLRWATSDTDWYVRCSAHEALARIGGSRVGATIRKGLLDPHPVVRRFAATALVDSIGEAAREVLHDALLREEDNLARVGLWAALAELGDEEALRRTKQYALSDDAHLAGFAKGSLEVIARRSSSENDRTGRLADD